MAYKLLSYMFVCLYYRVYSCASALSVDHIKRFCQFEMHPSLFFTILSAYKMPSNNVTRDGVPHDRYLVFEGLRFQSSKKAFIIISQSLTDMVQFVIRHTLPIAKA